ncbi:hypothetical protein NTE19_003360 [Vibrio fluvialis]|nr:hypothetical protein [Vibrio fluvialis]
MTKGPFSEGGVLENGTGFACSFSAPVAVDNTPKSDDLILASMGEDALFASVSDFADKSARSLAGAIVLVWAEDSFPTYQLLEELVIGEVAEPEEDDDGELDDDEQADFEDLMSLVAGALVAFSGKDAKAIQKAIDDEDDDLLESIAAAVMKATEEQDSDEMLADFAVKEALLLSSTEVRIRGGEVVRVKKKRRHKRASSAQRAALKKARRKAHSGAAKARRKKSMRMRMKRGL